MEMRKRREMAAREFEDEQKLQAMAKVKEKEMQKIARMREQQRLEKQETQRAQTEAILKNIEMKAIKKMHEMELAEIERKKRMALKKELHTKALIEKRAKAEKRINDALHSNNLVIFIYIYLLVFSSPVPSIIHVPPYDVLVDSRG
jgi:hypothetical protein